MAKEVGIYTGKVYGKLSKEDWEAFEQGSIVRRSDCLVIIPDDAELKVYEE